MPSATANAGRARGGRAGDGAGAGAAARARARVPGAGILEAGPEDADLPEARFDAISLVHVIEHLPDPVASLAACRRLLAPGAGSSS